MVAGFFDWIDSFAVQIELMKLGIVGLGTYAFVWLWGNYCGRRDYNKLVRNIHEIMFHPDEKNTSINIKMKAIRQLIWGRGNV